MMNYLLYQTILTPGMFIILGIILISTIIFFYSLFKKEKDFEQKEQTVLQDYGRIVQEAQVKAKEIIEQATTQAATIVTQAQATRITIDREEDITFNKIANEQEQLLQTNTKLFFDEYQASLNEVKNHYTSQLNDMLNQIKSTTEKEVQDLKNSLQTQMIGSKEGVAKLIQDDFAQTEIEINEYKRHRIEKVQAQIDSILVKVCEEVLGKIIPLHDHEELILQSLENAKSEGLFQI